MSQDSIPQTTPSQRPCRASCIVHAEEQLFCDLVVSLLATRSGVAVTPLTAIPGDQRRGLLAAGHQLLLLVVNGSSPEAALAVAAAFLDGSPQGGVIAVVEPGGGFTAPAWLEPRLKAVIDRGSPLRQLWTAIEDGLASSASSAAEAKSLLRDHRMLSSREAEVLRLIGSGLTNREIGDQLGLSTQTVRHHRKRIAAKLGADGPELMRWATLAAATRVSADPQPSAAGADRSGGSARHQLLERLGDENAGLAHRQ